MSAPRTCFGPFEFDPAAFRLLRDGDAVRIEPKALDLLQLLVARAPTVVDKSEIFAIVWKDVAVTDNALTRLVTHLRKALADDPRAPRYIETIATRGYRFVAPLSTPESAPHPETPGLESRRSRWMYAALVVTIALVAWAGSRLLRSAEMSGVRRSELPALLEYPRPGELQPRQLTAGRGFDGYAAFSPDGRSVSFSSDRSGSLEIYVQALASGSIPVALTSNGRQNTQPSWSPDGQLIAFHEMAGNGIWIVPSRGGAARKISDFGSRPAWSPDGHSVAFQSLPATDLNAVSMPGALSTIWVAAVDGRSPAHALTRAGEPTGPHLAPAWAPDGRRIYFAASAAVASKPRTSLWELDVSSGSSRVVAANDQLSPDYALADDGRGLFFVARGYGTIWWLPLPEDGEGITPEPRPTTLATKGASVGHLALSRDGRRLAWTTLDGSAHLWASDSSEPGASPLTRGLGVWYGLPAPASDGRIAFAGGLPGGDRMIFIGDTSRSIRQITADEGSHGGPQWLPGEREVAVIASHDGADGFWALDVVTGRERLLFHLAELRLPSGRSQRSTAQPSKNIVFSPDFQQLVMGIVDGGVSNLWTMTVRAGKPQGTFVQRTFETEGASYPAWSPDGRFLAYECHHGTDTHVCVADTTTGDSRQLTYDGGQSWVGGWSADGDAVLFAAQKDAVWNIRTVSRTTHRQHAVTQFADPRSFVRYPRWDGAANRIVFERSETVGRLWAVSVP